jgi:uncharacterized membrane protein YbhN (UPF0104 family)
VCERMQRARWRSEQLDQWSVRDDRPAPCNRRERAGVVLGGRGSVSEPVDVAVPTPLPGPVDVVTGRTTTSSLLRRSWPALRYLLGLGLLALVIWVLSSHTAELSGAESVFDHLRWGWLVPAVLVEAGSYGCLVQVQRRLLGVGGVRPPRASLAGVTLGTQAIVNSVPAGAAAASFYNFRWYRRFGADDALALWALVGTVVAGVLALAVVAAAGLAIAAEQGATLDLVPATIGVLVGTLALGVLFFSHRPQRAVLSTLLRASRRVIRRPKADPDAVAARIVGRLTAYRLGWRQAVTVLSWATGNWLLDCGCFAISFVAIGSGIPWKGLLLAYGAGQLAANLPITPGGLGAVEGSITIALVAFGGDRLATVEAVLIYRLISFWAELVVGWAAVGRLALGVRAGRWRREVLAHDPAVEALVSRVRHPHAGGGGGQA